MRTRSLVSSMGILLLVPACFAPSDDPLADDSATGDDAADDDGPSGPTSGADGATADDPGEGPSDDQGDDPSADEAATVDPTDDGDTDPSADESTTDGTPMPCDGTCVQPAPDGWNGPVVLAQATDRPASCSDPAYSHAVASGYAGVVADAASCGCECDVGDAATCDDEGLLARHSESDCGDLPFALPLELGCNDVSDQSDRYYTWSPTASGGSCEASASVEVPPLEYTGRLAACATEDTASGACEGDSACMPTPADDAAVCFWSVGDVECPDSLGGVREVFYADAPTDTRSCEACTCDEPEIWCDQPGVMLIGNNDTCGVAGTPLAIPIAPDVCVHYNGLQSVLWSAAGTPHTVCDSPSDPGPTGGVVPQGAVTVCCA